MEKISVHWWTLAFLILSPPLQNFHVVLPTKKCLLCFLSLALIKVHVALFLVELRWSAAHFLFSLSVFVFMDSSVVSALQEAPMAMRFPVKITSSCI